MQIVIDIGEEYIKQIDRIRFLIGGKEDRSLQINVINAIKNGTPLPKGHGRLKDFDKIVSDGINKGFCDWYDEMKYAETIIEADKEG